jgi:hypothetical protein
LKRLKKEGCCENIDISNNSGSCSVAYFDDIEYLKYLIKRRNKMSIIVKKPEGDFEELQPGTYQAVCRAVFDIGSQKREYLGQISWKKQVIVMFEVNERMAQEPYINERFNISKWYTQSLHEKSVLRKDLENWRGKSFTEDELQGFDLEKLVGINCMLTIIKSKNGKSTIGGIGPVMKNIELLTIEKPVNDIPEWVMNIKAKSLEMQGDQENTTLDPYKNDEDIPF